MKKYLLIFCTPILFAACASETEGTEQAEQTEVNATAPAESEAAEKPTGEVSEEVKQEVEATVEKIEATTNTADSILKSLE